MYKKFLRIPTAISLTVFSVLCTSPLAFSDDIQALAEKYSAQEIASILSRNTYSANSRDGFELIPDPYKYRGAFLRLILTQDGSRQDFSPKDWNIIMTLPDHDDYTFASPSMESLKFACSMIDSETKLSTQQKAILISDVEDSSARALEDHYDSVLKSLSDSGRQRLLDEVDDLSRSSNISWSSMDLVGLSEDIPEYADIVISNSCHKILTAPDPEVTSKLLSDAPKSWTTIDPR